jgi:hypothetical protein
MRASASRRTVARAGVRWDRVGRLALLAVLLVLVYLYVSAGVSLLRTWRASRQDGARVAALTREHTYLTHERAALRLRYDSETEARRLGMGRPGEKHFLVSDLPDN